VQPEIERRPTSNPTHAQLHNTQAVCLWAAYFQTTSFSLGCTKEDWEHLVRLLVSYPSPCVCNFCIASWSPYRVCVGANTDRPPARRRVHCLHVHYATLFVQERMYSEHYTTSSSTHMLGTDQAYILYNFSMFRLWHTCWNAVWFSAVERRSYLYWFHWPHKRERAGQVSFMIGFLMCQLLCWSE